MDPKHAAAAARIARRLKDLMANYVDKDGSHGISLARLEVLTEGALGKSRLGNYTQGTRLMREPTAKVLAEVFDVPTAYILCLEDGDMPLLTKVERDLLRDWRSLPENTRMSLARHLAVLALEHRDPVSADKMNASGFAKPPERKHYPKPG